MKTNLLTLLLFSGFSVLAQVGIGTTSPDTNSSLHVVGNTLLEGDFLNQEALGSHGSAVQNVPFTNLVPVPINNTTMSITIADGSGTNNSAVFISGFARVFGGNIIGGNSSMGGYFIVLERDTDPAFGSAIILTYTAGACYIETPNGLGSAAIAYGGGGHVSYIDSSLVVGTYYYRLVFYANGVGITGGTYDIYQRDLNILQVKR